MSQQGLVRTQQLLNVIGQQLPSIAQASETPGVDLTQFIYGALMRSGLQPTAEVWTFIAALVGCIGPSGPVTLAPSDALKVEAEPKAA